MYFLLNLVAKPIVDFNWGTVAMPQESHPSIPNPAVKPLLKLCLSLISLISPFSLLFALLRQALGRAGGELPGGPGRILQQRQDILEDLPV